MHGQQNIKSVTTVRFRNWFHATLCTEVEQMPLILHRRLMEGHLHILSTDTVREVIHTRSDKLNK
jgi:hypothetical protein